MQCREKPYQIEREREEHLDPPHESLFAQAMIGKLNIVSECSQRTP
jgi:hypothetical protein